MKTSSACLLFLTAFSGLNVLSSYLTSGHSRNYRSPWQRAAGNVAWIQGYDAWLKEDARRLIDSYTAAVSLDPGNLTFWRLAAQTIATDLPQWEIRAQGYHPGAPVKDREEEIRRKYANRALEFFRKGSRYFEEDPGWYLTAAFLAEAYGEDIGTALAFLEKAVELPAIPFAVGKTYARLLVRRGDLEKAQAFLESWQTSVEDPGGELRRMVVEIENQRQNTAND